MAYALFQVLQELMVSSILKFELNLFKGSLRKEIKVRPGFTP